MVDPGWFRPPARDQSILWFLKKIFFRHVSFIVLQPGSTFENYIIAGVVRPFSTVLQYPGVLSPRRCYGNGIIAMSHRVGFGVEWLPPQPRSIDKIVPVHKGHILIQGRSTSYPCRKTYFKIIKIFII